MHISLDRTDIITCWPHLKRKIGQGEYLSTTHPFYENLCEIMDAIHMSQSEEMQDLLTVLGGAEIEPEMDANNKLRALWNEYCVHPHGIAGPLACILIHH